MYEAPAFLHAEAELPALRADPMSRSDDGAASSRRPSPPAWILLDNNAFINDWQNATTATALTSTGQPIRVTLAAAEPPRDSYFFVHCPCLTKKRKHGEDVPVFPWDMGRPVPPTVVCSEGDLALLCVPLSPDDHPTDYFIYRVGRRPWLRLLPATVSGAEFVRYAPLGLVPIGGGDGDHFAVAAVSYVSMESTHKLHVFRSDRGTWTTTPLVLGSRVYVVPTKVIAIGGGELCWVDLRQCILVCDVLNDDDPKPRLIPLPKLLPSNQPDKPHRRHPREYRDVVGCADGSITCVEIEHMWQLPDVSSADVLYDSELPLGRPPQKYEYHGWRIVTWNRAVSSNCWRKRALIHVDDIVANDPGHIALLRPMAGDSGQSLVLRCLRTQVPSLNVHGGDVVYVTVKASQHDTKAWMLAVDMAKKTLEEVAPISAEESACPSYLSCALSKYLNILKTD